jgi:hypothetical protein
MGRKPKSRTEYDIAIRRDITIWNPDPAKPLYRHYGTVIDLRLKLDKKEFPVGEMAAVTNEASSVPCYLRIGKLWFRTCTPAEVETAKVYAKRLKLEDIDGPDETTHPTG